MTSQRERVCINKFNHGTGYSLLAAASARRRWACRVFSFGRTKPSTGERNYCKHEARTVEHVGNGPYTIRIQAAEIERGKRRIT